MCLTIYDRCLVNARAETAVRFLSIFSVSQPAISLDVIIIRIITFIILFRHLICYK